MSVGRKSGWSCKAGMGWALSSNVWLIHDACLTSCLLELDSTCSAAVQNEILGPDFNFSACLAPHHGLPEAMNSMLSFSSDCMCLNSVPSPGYVPLACKRKTSSKNSTPVSIGIWRSIDCIFWRHLRLLGNLRTGPGYAEIA